MNFSELKHGSLSDLEQKIIKIPEMLCQKNQVGEAGASRGIKKRHKYSKFSVIVLRFRYYLSYFHNCDHVMSFRCNEYLV